MERKKKRNNIRERECITRERRKKILQTERVEGCILSYVICVFNMN